MLSLGPEGLRCVAYTCDLSTITKSTHPHILHMGTTNVTDGTPSKAEGRGKCVQATPCIPL